MTAITGAREARMPGATMPQQQQQPGPPPPPNSHRPPGGHRPPQLPQLQPRPFSGHLPPGPPSEAGPATAELNKHASKVRSCSENIVKFIYLLLVPIFVHYLLCVRLRKLRSCCEICTSWYNKARFSA